MAEDGEAYLDIEEVEVDDNFINHLADRRRIVRPREVQEILDDNPVFLTNDDPRGEHRAPVIMIGRTRSRRLLAIPIEPTGRPGVWRAVTAFAPTGALRRAYDESVEQEEE